MKKSIRLLPLCICFVAGFPAFAQQSDSTITGISRAFNPAISVNGLLYYMGSNMDKPSGVANDIESGLHLEELELAFSSNVDAYLKADATISFTEKDVSVENIYVTTLDLPFSLQAKAGKLNVPFGIQNPLHTHAWPFVEPPLINEAIFGFDGWKDTGVTLSWLAPLPWYFNLTAAAFNGGSDTPFGSEHPGDIAGLVTLDNLFTLGNSATLRLGGSYAQGAAFLEGDSIFKSGNHDSQIWGADFQLKWRPPQLSRSRAFVLQSEYLEHKYFSPNSSIADPEDGYYVQALAQVSQFFWLQGRYDSLRRPDYLLENPDEHRYQDRWSAAVAFVPTEFQAYKIQYSNVNLGGKTEQRVMVQLNITVGSHPAHAY